MKIKVEGYGQFDISEEFIPQLLAWLGAHSGIKLQETDNSVRERTDNGFTGRELLNG
jgi:hypothetical protein